MSILKNVLFQVKVADFQTIKCKCANKKMLKDLGAVAFVFDAKHVCEFHNLTLINVSVECKLSPLKFQNNSSWKISIILMQYLAQVASMLHTKVRRGLLRFVMLLHNLLLKNSKKSLC